MPGDNRKWDQITYFDTVKSSRIRLRVFHGLRSPSKPLLVRRSVCAFERAVLLAFLGIILSRTLGKQGIFGKRYNRRSINPHRTVHDGVTPASNCCPFRSNADQWFLGLAMVWPVCTENSKKFVKV